MPIKTAISQARHGFDYYVRSLTTAALALVILGSVIYEIVANGSAPPLLVGWAGIVVGVYFGYHVTSNGVENRKAVESNAVQKVVSAAEAIAKPHETTHKRHGS